MTRAEVAVTRIRDLSSSDVGRENNCPDWGLSWFSLVFPSNCRIVPRIYLGPLPLPAKIFLIRHSYCHVSGVPWLIITGSEFDDSIYWQLLLQSLLIAINLQPKPSSLTAEIPLHSASRSATACKWPSLSHLTLRHEPPRKHIHCPATVIPYCWPGVFADTLPSNEPPIVATRLSGKVFTGSLPSNGYVYASQCIILPHDAL
jgi:hypothetical protein